MEYNISDTIPKLITHLYGLLYDMLENLLHVFMFIICMMLNLLKKIFVVYFSNKNSLIFLPKFFIFYTLQHLHGI